MVVYKDLAREVAVHYNLDMELLSVVEAASRKDCTTQAVRDAIAKGKIKGQQVGRSFVIMANRKFEEWEPNPKRQAGAIQGWKRQKVDR